MVLTSQLLAVSGEYSALQLRFDPLASNQVSLSRFRLRGRRVACSSVLILPPLGRLRFGYIASLYKHHLTFVLYEACVLNALSVYNPVLPRHTRVLGIVKKKKK